MMTASELTVTQDALSEFSESSRDEIREMCGPDAYQERFRVDRTKLEQLMQDDNCTAEMFFQRIMQSTNTYIAWPQRMKVGAKSKKDPHVRIAGQPEDVQIARERVLDVLQTTFERVNMKMDVSYTDHSHIIGKGGQTIKRVMESTRCHIHFPDSNRNSSVEKSNQVSIAGTLECVEKARSGIRRLMPLVFSFELPVNSALYPLPDANHPAVKLVSSERNVEVSFRSRFKLHSTLVVVKGCEWEVDSVKEATMQLVRLMCGETHASEVMIEMSLEISPQHHSVVLGPSSSNLKTIMQQTGTRILFPDAEDPNISQLKKSNIRISGPIEQVYLARQYLIGSLPLLVMFELPSHVMADYQESVRQFAQPLGVNIKVRQKPRQSSLSVLVRGIERNAANIYVACKKLLKLEGAPIYAEIPATYLIPGMGNTYHQSFKLSGASTGSPVSQFGGGGLSRSPWSAATCTRTSGTLQQGMLSPLPQHLTVTQRVLVPPQYAVHSPMYPSPDSAIHSASQSSISSPALSPHRSSTSTFPTSLADLSDLLQELPDRRAPGCERRSLQKISSLPNYKMQAYQAMQQKPCAGEVRVPTSQWSGAGLSFSMPEDRLREFTRPGSKQMVWGSPTGPDSTTGFVASNYLDCVPQRNLLSMRDNSAPKDLPTLLIQQGLERYINFFASQDIDLRTFMTLSEADLQELGITKFGHRRRMTVLITDLRERERQLRESQPWM